ncbi:MAG: carboxypeptidase-like regulatory domain-containing protein [Gemmatimonadaceae bacterium]|nr:carboxypeptidase-like regulatory domain-containing protein [Gemmatimonadaceae bacterium]
MATPPAVRPLVVVPLFALLGLVHPAAAQGIITGHVRAASSGAPLPDAAVIVIGAAPTAHTNARGDFVLPGVPPGTHTILVRRVGYRAATLQGIAVADSAVVTVTVDLAPAAPPLDTVVVQTADDDIRAPPPPPRTGA